MGGKSRKSGGVSKALINRILKSKGKTPCGSKKGGSGGQSKTAPRGLLDGAEEE